MYDAIVVGARCAGASVAFRLARDGGRVLLLDRSSFPSDTISTHVVWPRGVAKLQQWGLLAALQSTNCPPIRKMLFERSGFSLTGWGPPCDGAGDAYCPRRTILDQLLIEAAVNAGAEFRPAFHVTELTRDQQRVTGIRGASSGGAPVQESARVVIGADGRHSFVAQAVQAASYHVRPNKCCYYYSYWSDLPLEGFESYLPPGRVIMAAPTHDGATCVSVGWPNQAFSHVRADIHTNFQQSLQLAPRLAEKMAAARQVERFVGIGDVPNYFRRPYGPGWALVGDAGYHRDPVTAHGISDAFRDADLLAEALHSIWSDGQDETSALAAYERRRNAAALPLYEQTVQAADFAPPTGLEAALYRRLQSSESDRTQFFGVLAGTVPLMRFFAPVNLQRMLGDATSKHQVSAP